MSQVLLSVENLHARYGPIRALAGVSFQLHQGETISIVGANGAGKTSLMRVVSGLLSASAGHVKCHFQKTTAPIDGA
ncbi:ATP-binding cassette domain-containing protein [Eoetvoesiella caeni]